MIDTENTTATVFDWIQESFEAAIEFSCTFKLDLETIKMNVKFMSSEACIKLGAIG